METKVCIALGGGAARGLAHLGVLKVLHEEGIPIHLVTGTSLGALVGALYATRPDPCHWMTKVEAYLRSVHWRRSQMEFLRRAEEGNGGQGIFADMANLVRKSYFWGMTATHSAFVSEAEYLAFINPLIPDIDIQDTKIPFASVATDIQKGARYLSTDGSLRQAVSASCALPGIFPPVTRNGSVLVDGGWVERVPVRAGRELGGHVVIAVDVSADLKQLGSLSGLDIIMRTDAVARTYHNSRIVAEADLVIAPAVNSFHWADFRNPRSLYLAGEEAARARIDEIRQVLASADEKGVIGQLATMRDKVLAKLGLGIASS